MHDGMLASKFLWGFIVTIVVKVFLEKLMRSIRSSYFLYNYIMCFLSIKAVWNWGNFFPRDTSQKNTHGNECREDNKEIHICFLDTHSSLESRLRVLTSFAGYAHVKIQSPILDSQIKIIIVVAKLSTSHMLFRIILRIIIKDLHYQSHFTNEKL